jgi:membrane protein implicated in regulation of membrane protease activity
VGIFATLFGVGFVVLIISLIFGSDAEVEADADVDHGGHGPSIFSVKMIALLMVGFGAVSFGVRASTDSTMFVSSMAGVGGAIVVGALGYIIIRAFYASQESSTITDNDIVGCTANLIDAIGEGGNGQIACVIRGREITYLARSADGRAIARGVPVKVVSKTGNVVTVEPVG